MFFANAFVLLMDEGKRIIPGDTDEFILAANALRAVRRCQKAFTTIGNGRGFYCGPGRAPPFAAS
jgi:hypothetical protein